MSSFSILSTASSCMIGSRCEYFSLNIAGVMSRRSAATHASCSIHKAQWAVHCIRSSTTTGTTATQRTFLAHAAPAASSATDLPHTSSNSPWSAARVSARAGKTVAPGGVNAKRFRRPSLRPPCRNRSIPAVWLRLLF